MGEMVDVRHGAKPKQKAAYELLDWAMYLMALAPAAVTPKAMEAGPLFELVMPQETLAAILAQDNISHTDDGDFPMFVRQDDGSYRGQSFILRAR